MGFARSRGGAALSLPVTPDGRYFVHRGVLWRCTNPALPEAERARLVGELMAARLAVGVAKRGGDAVALAAARAQVDNAKVALGERGAPWWTDGAHDYNRQKVSSTPYAEWFTSLSLAAD